jgi:hypothetical protein
VNIVFFDGKFNSFNLMLAYNFYVELF